MKINYKPGLNRLLEQLAENSSTISPETASVLASDCEAISPGQPFVHIKNFTQARERLLGTPFWLAYGGARTATTWSMNVLELILASLSDHYIRAWEGDFRSPSAFFDTVNSSASLDAGLLKIHKPDELCNSLLLRGQAKAIVTTRDYPSVAVSWLRMRANPHSPFYKECTTEADILSFIKYEIESQKKKAVLPGCLFLKTKEINRNPCEAINSMAAHLEIEASRISVEAIAEATSRDRLIKLQNMISKSNAGHDAESYLHVDHIDTGDFDDDRARELVKKNFASQLDADGYLIN